LLRNKMNSRSIRIIVGAVLICIVGFLMWHSYFYRVINEDVTETETTNVFADSKFGYSIEFPKAWEMDRDATKPGAIFGYDPANENTGIMVWFKDSDPVTNQEQLLAFVEGDRKYGDEQQNLKTLHVEKIRVGTLDSIRWRTIDSDGLYSDMYYFYHPNPDPQTQVIWVWTVMVIAKTEAELSSPVVLNALSTFKLLD
jgi:hypothetical protein